MRFAGSFLILASLLFPFPVAGQQPPQRDAQAVVVLTEAVGAAGGITPLRAIQDFRASGTITYYWADEEVQGSVTVKGRGLGQFRLEASLPTGLRSWVVNNGTGSVRETDGTEKSIPYHNAVNFGTITFPLVRIAAALQNPSTRISYGGVVTVNDRPAHQVRIQEVLNTNPEIGETLSKLTRRDFFIDAATFQLVGTLDTIHPQRHPSEGHAHEVLFADYRLMNGVLVPFSITERVAGQRTWTIQLDRVGFNVGLQDADFQVTAN